MPPAPATKSRPAAATGPDGRALPPAGAVLLFEKTLSKSDVRVGMVIVPKATAAAYFAPLPVPGTPSPLVVRGPDPANPGRVLEQSTFFRAYHNRRPGQADKGTPSSRGGSPAVGASKQQDDNPPSTAGVMFVVEPIKDLFSRRAPGDPVSISIIPSDGSLWVDAREGGGTAAAGGPAAAAAASAAARAAAKAARARGSGGGSVPPSRGGRGSRRGSPSPEEEEEAAAAAVAAAAAAAAQAAEAAPPPPPPPPPPKRASVADGVFRALGPDVLPHAALNAVPCLVVAGPLWAAILRVDGVFYQAIFPDRESALDALRAAGAPPVGEYVA